MLHDDAGLEVSIGDDSVGADPMPDLKVDTVAVSSIAELSRLLIPDATVRPLRIELMAALDIRAPESFKLLERCDEHFCPPLPDETYAFCIVHLFTVMSIERAALEAAQELPNVPFGLFGVVLVNKVL